MRFGALEERAFAFDRPVFIFRSDSGAQPRLKFTFGMYVRASERPTSGNSVEQQHLLNWARIGTRARF